MSGTEPQPGGRVLVEGHFVRAYRDGVVTVRLYDAEGPVMVAVRGADVHPAPTPTGWTAMRDAVDLALLNGASCACTENGDTCDLHEALETLDVALSAEEAAAAAPAPVDPFGPPRPGLPSLPSAPSGSVRWGPSCNCAKGSLVACDAHGTQEAVDALPAPAPVGDDRVEVVARAMAEHNGTPWDFTPRDADIGDDVYRSEARAVLAALDAHRTGPTS